MKVKIIDLLNKIANGEEVPEKIKWNDVIWEYNKDEKEYYSQRTNEAFFNDTSSVGLWIMAHLNDTVEILEEQQDIDIQSIKELEPLEDYEVDKTDVRLNRELINKILQWAKQVEKKIKDKE